MSINQVIMTMTLTMLVVMVMGVMMMKMMMLLMIMMMLIVMMILIKNSLTNMPARSPGRRAEGALEPAFYHAGPPALDEEIIHCYSVGAINDMTPGMQSHMTPCILSIIIPLASTEHQVDFWFHTLNSNPNATMS